MKIEASGLSEPTINFTLEQECGDVNINANGHLIAYFHVSPDDEVYLQLVSGIDGDVKGLRVLDHRIEVHQ
jgi:hypothetical protein